MGYQRQLLFGGLFVALGLMLLVSKLLGVNIWAICWPSVLIIIGIWLLLRPRLELPGSHVKILPLGDIKRRNDWVVEDEEIWMIVGDIHLDMTQARIPTGETNLSIYGLVGSIDLLVPQDMGVSISSTAFLTDAKLGGRKRQVFLSTLHHTSEGYQSAERRIHLETGFFVADLDIKQIDLF